MTGPGTRRWRLVRATATAIPPSLRRFNSRVRARRLRSARPWLILAGVVLLAGAGAYVALGTSVLGVQRVDIRGAGYVGADAIRTAAAIPADAPLLGLDTGAVARRVERLAPVAHADVSRRLPSTVIIDVRLRVAVATVPIDKHTYVLLDATGVAFRTVSAAPDGLPVVEVARPGPGDPSTVGALRVLAALPSDLRDQLDHITARTPSEIDLLLTDGREIVWGDATDNATKARVAVSLLAHPGTVIDVSAPNLVTVR